MQRQATPPHPFSRRTVSHLRQDLDCWSDGWRDFALRHQNNPAVVLNPLYPLPSDLLQALAEHLPDWFSPTELSFEQELQELCEQHHAVGIFCGHPAYDLTLHRSSPPAFSKDLIRWLEWESFWTPAHARMLLNMGLERIDPLVERLDAYRGWLLTNPLFRVELQLLKTRWENAVARLGCFPRYPVQVGAARPRRPRQGRDVTEAFVQDFISFYDRWELAGFATWDLPQPRGANLSGVPLPPSVAAAPTVVAIQVSPILHLSANYPLRNIVEEAQRSQSPSHLQGWLQVQKQQHAGDLRFGRFRRTFLLHFYRDIVLGGRYIGRFADHIDALDGAFGEYLGGLGEESVKKLRVQMAALRRANP